MSDIKCGEAIIPEEKFTSCKPYLEYRDGVLYEVISVGENGSSIARVIDRNIVQQIREDERRRVESIMCELYNSKNERGKHYIKEYMRDVLEKLREV